MCTSPPAVPTRSSDEVSDSASAVTGSLRVVRRAFPVDVQTCDVPHGDEALLRRLRVFVVDAYRVVHPAASDRLHRRAPELVRALAEEIHLVHRTICGAREEQALRRVPCEAGDRSGEVEGRQ